MKKSVLYREAALSVLRDNDQAADVKCYIIAALMDAANMEELYEKAKEERNEVVAE